MADGQVGVRGLAALRRVEVEQGRESGDVPTPPLNMAEPRVLARPIKYRPATQTFVQVSEQCILGIQAKMLNMCQSE